LGFSGFLLSFWRDSTMYMQPERPGLLRVIPVSALPEKLRKRRVQSKLPQLVAANQYSLEASVSSPLPVTADPAMNCMGHAINQPDFSQLDMFASYHQAYADIMKLVGVSILSCLPWLNNPGSDLQCCSIADRSCWVYPRRIPRDCVACSQWKVL